MCRSERLKGCDIGVDLITTDQPRGWNGRFMQASDQIERIVVQLKKLLTGENGYKQGREGLTRADLYTIGWKTNASGTCQMLVSNWRENRTAKVDVDGKCL